MPQHVIPLAVAAALAAAPGLAAAKGGAFREAAHGRRDTGVLRVPGIARGECSHCHGAPRDALGQRSDGRAHTQLFALNDNALCSGCHAHRDGSWLGDERYEPSAHGAGVLAVWPGPVPPARGAQDAGKCVNCHDPHGVKDGRGLVPALLRVRGASLCLACHGGIPAADVASAFSRTYRHPLVVDDPEASPVAFVGQPPGLGAVGQLVDGGSCSACHNPHAAEAARGTARPEVAPALAGVRRARVSNGPPGASPVQTLSPETDPTPVREFEVCFKCHSTAVALPARSSLVAAAFNPANASFHPVEAQARNRGIDPRAFGGGWGPGRLVTCSDCHGADGGATRGPHGSRYPRILRSRYLPPSAGEPVLETDLCFDCHAFRTYGDGLSREEAAFSRFPTHGAHAARGVSCGSCHAVHGSVDQPALLALRSPGMIAYAQDRGGGSCTVTCHATTGAIATYLSPYPR